MVMVMAVWWKEKPSSASALSQDDLQSTVFVFAIANCRFAQRKEPMVKWLEINSKTKQRLLWSRAVSSVCSAYKAAVEMNQSA